MPPVTVKLRNPIEWGKDRIDELTFRPMSGKDMRRLPKAAEMDVTLELAARLSGQPDGVIDRLTGDDLWEVLDVVAGFTRPSQPTGSEPSPS